MPAPVLRKPSGTPIQKLSVQPPVTGEGIEGEHMASKSKMVAACLCVVMKLSLLNESGSSYCKSSDGHERPGSTLVDGVGEPRDDQPVDGVNSRL